MNTAFAHGQHDSTARIQTVKGEWLFLGAVLVVATCLRFYRVAEKTLWLDEAFSIWIAHHSLWEIWGWLIRIDQHPPLYYNLLHFWIGLFGDLQGTVRILSGLASALTVLVFYAAARRLVDRPVAMIAVIILSVSPFHVRYAQETRMYALLTLEVACVLFFLARLLTTREQSSRDWVGLALSQSLAMLTHNTAAVYLPLALNVAMGIMFLQGKRVLSPFWMRWLKFQGLALLLWLPWAVPFVIQVIGVDREFWIWPPWPDLVMNTFRSFHFAFLPDHFVFWPDVPLAPVRLWAYPLLSIIGLLGCSVSKRRTLLVSLFLLPHIIALMVSLRRPIYYEHTLIWTTLPYCLLVAAGIRTLAHQVLSTKTVGIVKSGVQMVFMLIILTLSGLSLNGYYFWFQKEGWDQAAAHVAEHVQPGDLILFNASWVQIPFEYYYRHFALNTELRGLPVDMFEREELEPKMTETEVSYLHQLIRGREQVWLVYSHDWYTDPAQIIPREMAKALRETGRSEFVGLQVIRYNANSRE